MTLGALLTMLRSIEGRHRMPFLTLGEAVERVLQRLADQREEKAGEVISLAGRRTRAEGEAYPARLKGAHGSTVSATARNPEKQKARRPVRT